MHSSLVRVPNLVFQDCWYIQETVMKFEETKHLKILFWWYSKTDFIRRENLQFLWQFMEFPETNYTNWSKFQNFNFTRSLVWVSEGCVTLEFIFKFIERRRNVMKSRRGIDLDHFIPSKIRCLVHNKGNKRKQGRTRLQVNGLKVKFMWMKITWDVWLILVEHKEIKIVNKLDFQYRNWLW